MRTVPAAPAVRSTPSPSPRRDPHDPARWERPALAAVLGVAALLYAWGMGNAALHPYYGAAVRSMAASGRAFFFGGLDASGSITLDKLPGAFWPDAVSVGIFGPHTWAVALPHVVEGVLAVWLLHRIVRAWAGPFAALTAALVLTFTPVTVVLNRATIPDTALTLLLVAAAGALQKAVRTGRLLPLVTCGVWVGLAFQTKMLQAWLVLPVFAGVFLLAAPGSPVRRAGRVLLSGAVALAVSCSWALIAWLTPTDSRPYIDATSNNNPFSLVFGYNGLSRFGDDATAFGAVPATAASRTTGNTGWGMLVNHVVGPQIAWFLPLAALAVVTALVWRAREPRTDPLRAGFLLWGGWLAVHAVVFSVSNGNHAYYTAALAPAIAALAGGGLALLRTAYGTGGRRRLWLPGAIGLTVAWALVLDGPTWFAPGLLVFAVFFAACGVFGLWSSGPRASRRRVNGSLATGVAAMLLVPAGWAVSSLDPLYAGAATSPTAGPVGEFHHRALRDPAALRRAALGRPSGRDTALLDYLVEHRAGEKYLLATQAAYPAERLLRAQAQPVLVMGGFTGRTPFPGVPRLSDLIATHQLRYVLLTHLRPTTPATTWVKSHCERIRSSDYGWRAKGNFGLYDCRTPADRRG
ncbi:glycosyltransferase family 39 protein [Streptomyces roseirectus]|uniref:Glycosyltransferase family 39 protein n=1 Tax=Streptomyces roseirectus TaxID=2768066 RepID=A0A7H0IEP9_9ACTN|nr:glycosyltransferase family 39 protein [Streptomyces roseirectus]QNP71265.1 glycosyltransferase family 39 protein [Streptomyces roseirectus]